MSDSQEEVFSPLSTEPPTPNFSQDEVYLSVCIFFTLKYIGFNTRLYYFIRWTMIFILHLYTMYLVLLYVLPIIISLLYIFYILFIGR